MLAIASMLGFCRHSRLERHREARCSRIGDVTSQCIAKMRPNTKIEVLVRALLSYLVGLMILLALVGTGSAGIAQRPEMVRVELGSDAAALYGRDLVESPTASATLIIGCRPPRAGSLCFPEQLSTPVPPQPTPYALVPREVSTVEDWRPLVKMFFEPEDIDRALAIIRCESGGNPTAKNPSSSASGLFQHLGSQWRARADRAGWEGADVFDPVANTAVAAWLAYHGGGWRHWSASRGCW